MTKFDYQINPLGFSDWHELHTLLTECFAFMEGRIDPPSSLTQMSPEIFREKAADETMIIVRSKGVLIACGFLKEVESSVYLGKLAVKPPFQRQGILKEIMTMAEAFARQKNKFSLDLETRIELIENHKTFCALGFVKTSEGRHDGYDCTTFITMSKSL